MTLPVQGVSDKSNEVFTGTATGYMSGKGDLKINTNTGLRCVGEFKYIDGFEKGVGGFSCSDGRQGDFTFTSTGVAGKGYALLNDGNKAQFLFGQVPNYSEVEWDHVQRVHETLSAQMKDSIFYCDEYPKTPKCSK
ncbi:MAG: hypothetical protein HQL69_22370 [Magnetococcales bacterium]|nr:hypothetical protein [Magnetococcales bacterium]